VFICTDRRVSIVSHRAPPHNLLGTIFVVMAAVERRNLVNSIKLEPQVELS
jgi:hypothetical protein